VIQAAGKKEQVETMFNDIAPRYDFLNHFLSAGIDRLWRQTLVKTLAQYPHRNILDLATGTADLAIAASVLNPENITGIDIAGEMLNIGNEKVKRKGLGNIIKLLPGDSEKLPFADCAFDATMVAFGVRNYENLNQGLSEMHRVLKPGGGTYILEFSMPTQFPVKQVYHFYFNYILPALGSFVSKHRSAYTYLPASVIVFPQGDRFLSIMKDIGFINVSARKLTFGIASLYTGFRKNG